MGRQRKITVGEEWEYVGLREKKQKKWCCLVCVRLAQKQNEISLSLSLPCHVKNPLLRPSLTRRPPSCHSLALHRPLLFSRRCTKFHPLPQPLHYISFCAGKNEFPPNRPLRNTTDMYRLPRVPYPRSAGKKKRGTYIHTYIHSYIK